MDQPGRQDLEPYHILLYRLLATRCDEGELRTLCFHLSVDYDDLPASGKANKARELIAFLQRHDRIPELLMIGRELRPDFPWDEITGPTPQALPRIEFVNREHELNMLRVERLRASQSPYVLLNAPAGYGKSYLLARLVATIKSDERLVNAWGLRYLNCSHLREEQIDTIVETITGHTALDSSKEAPAAVCDFVLGELAAPLPEGRRAALLIFDSVERLHPEARVWLYELLRELQARTRIGHRELITVRVIIAGRYVEAFWEGYAGLQPRPPAPQRINLSPFDQHAIQELIWDQAQALQIPLDDRTVAQISEQVEYLGGGHPQVICGLVDYLAGEHFAIGPRVADYFESYRAHLVQTYLAPVAAALVESLASPLRTCAQILSVFRRVNANTLQELVRAGILPPETNAINLLGDMQRAQLLQGPSIREPFYRDNALRRVWALDMAHRSPESRAQYQRFNRLALEIYENWIQDLGRGLPDTPLKATQRLLSIVEWLFHALQDPDVDGERLRSSLQAHVKVLSTGDQPLAVANLIANDIQRDAEVGYLLRHRLGEGGFATLCSWLGTRNQVEGGERHGQI
jgi:hypothetical protein